MTADWEKYSFYKALEVEPGAGEEEIKEAHARLAKSLNPDVKPPEQKRAAAIALITAEAALRVLLDQRTREAYEARLREAQKAESERQRIETKRTGKFQEQQSIEEDEKLTQAALKYDSAKSALADFYYDQLFRAAKESRLETAPPEKLMEWLSSERAEAVRRAEERGRRTSFRIDWRGFTGVQDMRKKRTEEISEVVGALIEKFGLA